MGFSTRNLLPFYRPKAARFYTAEWFAEHAQTGPWNPCAAAAVRRGFSWRFGGPGDGGVCGLDDSSMRSSPKIPWYSGSYQEPFLTKYPRILKKVHRVDGKYSWASDRLDRFCLGFKLYHFSIWKVISKLFAQMSYVQMIPFVQRWLVTELFHKKTVLVYGSYTIQGHIYTAFLFFFRDSEIVHYVNSHQAPLRGI